MKAHLLYRERDLHLEQPLPTNADALVQDLELSTLFEAMAAGDAFLREVVERVILTSLDEPEAIRYRQAILRDCLARPEVVRELYALAVDAVESKQKVRHFWFRDSPDQLLHKSLRILELLADALKRLRALTDEHASAFESEGLQRFSAMLRHDLDDDYLRTVDYHRRELEFRRGALISARLGRGNRGADYVLRRPHERSLLERLTPNGRPSHSFTIPARDDNGLKSIADIRDRGINQAANALAQSVDHILSFFTLLRAELAFYVGCLNLHEQLAQKDQPTCFPEPLDGLEPAFAARDLYDVALAFHLGSPVVGNDVSADGKGLVMITGANQGGKSTFLRSVGLAQLMLQAGMFTPAQSLRANVCTGVFTHFKREEDATMTSGKLDEELARMREISDTIQPGGLLLCNESFASTNEREGSEIARQVIRALIESKVKVFFVTHLFDLASSLYEQSLESALFLRAERTPDGGRTFRVLPNEPLPTSYGEDSYRRIFSLSAEQVAAVAEGS
jgi:MutS domain V